MMPLFNTKQVNTKLCKHTLILILAISLSACASQTPPKETAEKDDKEQVAEVISVEVKKNPKPLKHTRPHAEEELKMKMEAVQVTGARQRSLAVADMSYAPVLPGHKRPGIVIPENSLAGENYAQLKQNGVMDVLQNPVSTFSIDVDTGSYSNLRRILNQGALPPKGAVRTEELINYFDYDYATPRDQKQPFLVNSSMMASPWNKDKYLLQIGIKAWEQPQDTKRDSANLVFLVDVSGSMNQPNKLPLLKKSLRMLSKQMTANDKISIVVYAGASGVVLEPTAANNLTKITNALDRLSAGGSTNGEAGINLAYQMAESAFIKNGINRILLATDGDFNVGQSSTEALVELIEQKRKKGIALSTLGFGGGNYNDHLMEQLADKGNGSYSYIDNLLEAKKVLVDELDSQLITVAADVKLQLEFNPSVVSEYRLIGYENRHLNREDFNNDQVDAGEIGAGHTVTAVYEISLASSEGRSMEPLRYQKESAQKVDHSGELAFMRIRYKAPGESSSQLIESPLLAKTLIDSSRQPAIDSKFSAAVIAFADKLQGGKYTANYSYEDIQKLVQQGQGNDSHGLRAEFNRLVQLAQSIDEAS